MPQPDRTIPNPRTVPRPYTEDLLGEAGQGEWRGLEAERWEERHTNMDQKQPTEWTGFGTCSIAIPLM